MVCGRTRVWERIDGLRWTLTSLKVSYSRRKWYWSTQNAKQFWCCKLFQYCEGILNFSLFLSAKLSLLILFASFLLSVVCFFYWLHSFKVFFCSERRWRKVFFTFCYCTSDHERALANTTTLWGAIKCKSHELEYRTDTKKSKKAKSDNFCYLEEQ